MLESLRQPIWVHTKQSLNKMVEDIASQTRVGVDTESNSLHAYREQVCLLQFSTKKADYLVDPLALELAKENPKSRRKQIKSYSAA